MIQRIFLFWSKLRQSLWFLPSLLSIAGGVLSWMALRLPDQYLRTLPVLEWLLHNAGAQHGHELLSNLLTSMITMTSLVISLTMVVLTLAVRQLGPRLIGHFMGSAWTQVTLGAFIGTIVYLLLTMRVIHEHMPEDSVPHAAITLGSILSLLSIFILLFFIHHLARSIVADEAINRVGRMLESDLRRYAKRYEKAEAASWLVPENSIPLLLKQSGYVQTIDYDALIGLLAKHQGHLILSIRPGQHILAGTIHGGLLLADPEDSQNLFNEIEDAIAIGDEPVAGQDVEFGVRQLVEIALRALSAGENDPYTAVRAIDRLSAALREALPLHQEHCHIRDKNNIVRLTMLLSSFEGILNAAFNEIRQSSGKPNIAIRLLEKLNDLSMLADKNHQKIILQQGEAVREAAMKANPEHYDLLQIQQSYEKLKTQPV